MNLPSPDLSGLDLFHIASILAVGALLGVLLWQWQEERAKKQQASGSPVYSLDGLRALLLDAKMIDPFIVSLQFALYNEGEHAAFITGLRAHPFCADGDNLRTVQVRNPDGVGDVGPLIYEKWDRANGPHCGVLGAKELAVVTVHARAGTLGQHEGEEAFFPFLAHDEQLGALKTIAIGYNEKTGGTGIMVFGQDGEVAPLRRFPLYAVDPEEEEEDPNRWCFFGLLNNRYN